MKTVRAKSLFAVLILSVCVLTATAQNVCDWSSKTAVLYLNLRTGISPAQTQSIVGNALKIKIKKRGERTFFQNYIKSPAPDSLKGIRALYLRFYDLKLYQIEIFYEPRPDLPNLEAIKNALSSQLNLLADWQNITNREQIKYAKFSRRFIARRRLCFESAHRIDRRSYSRRNRSAARKR